MKFFNKHLKPAMGKLAYLGKLNCETALQYRKVKDVDKCIEEAQKEGLLALISEFGELLKSNSEVFTFHDDILMDNNGTCYQVL